MKIDNSIAGKDLVLQSENNVPYDGMKCLFKNNPEKVFLTEDGRFTAVLSQKEKILPFSRYANEKAMHCPYKILSAFEGEVYSNWYFFVKMVTESKIPFSFDLGDEVGNVFLCPVDKEEYVDTKDAIFITKENSKRFWYEISKGFYKGFNSDKISYEEYLEWHDFVFA